jgi:hypothetical protein
LNELLDRTQVAACHSEELFLTVACRNPHAVLTLELTGRNEP